MIQEISSAIKELLGVDVEGLNFGHMVLRAAIIYITTLIMVRIGDKRFLGKTTAFDFILGIIIGSVVSRAINGTAPFFPTIGAGFVLVGIHWLFAVIAFRVAWFGKLVKGKPRHIIKDGKVNYNQMRKSHITESDLIGELRSESNIKNIDEVKEAFLETSGKISVAKLKESSPKILDIKVEDGIKTVRIKLD